MHEDERDAPEPAPTPAGMLMTRAEYNRLVKEEERAALASAARKDREKRRRFLQEQKEMTRNRGASLRDKEAARVRARLAELRQKNEKPALGQPRVVNLANLSSEDRAAVKKLLQSQSTGGALLEA